MAILEVIACSVADAIEAERGGAGRLEIVRAMDGNICRCGTYGRIVAAIGLLDASLHACDEAGLAFEHAGNCVFHQLLRVLAIRRSHLLEPGFHVGREMYFHELQVTRKPAVRQPEERKRGQSVFKLVWSLIRAKALRRGCFS